MGLNQMISTPSKVEVWTEKSDGDRHQISARLTLPHTPEKIWQVLTHYEALPEFIPHLVESQRLSHPNNGIRLEQVGSKCPLHFCFSARVVLDLIEDYPHSIQFQMIEGDFKMFSGKWQLLPTAIPEKTQLSYSVQVVPKIFMPIAILEKQLYQDLPLNLMAISQRVSQLFN